jgi:hypothetical protein
MRKRLARSRHQALGQQPRRAPAGNDKDILAARHEFYCAARQRNPRRWSGATRNWTPIGVVTLNPERDAIVEPHRTGDKQPLAA